MKSIHITKKSKFYSEAKSPIGKTYYNPKSFRYVLVDIVGRDFKKWSNNKETLEKEIEFLSTQSFWKKHDLVILETEIKPLS